MRKIRKRGVASDHVKSRHVTSNHVLRVLNRLKVERKSEEENHQFMLTSRCLPLRRTATDESTRSYARVVSVINR